MKHVSCPFLVFHALLIDYYSEYTHAYDTLVTYGSSPRFFTSLVFKSCRPTGDNIHIVCNALPSEQRCVAYDVWLCSPSEYGAMR